ncbi:hypothetical protein SDRG_06190 [Saprolegnia diclina VS20]|uniref:Uncharacterized protein n=1 Tax=Saprolegnia diclina (strain VS20) TaxID=1156394 RepID=T0QRY5_SAPDV|nr:hypothetical protein SDRG_06190 [Saprolegnia diclina VS20]EQC36755.1 hypothetical protein SDRG_06190 [Saprolegnia diclina VS20]|eukprot:XP_008610176.1 hypothetical protein SDRG_06190 [Saprolegnia diclina VS20]
MARLLPTSIKLCFGLTYLSASMGASLWFLDIIGPGLSNDHFWPNFDPTSAQTYLIDVFHRHLSVTNALVIDLYDPSQGILKAYGRASTTAFAKPTYPRLRSLVEYTSVADAITGFQSLDPGYVFNLMTLYCWADFGKRWEVAHTAARQARCAATMSNNGAVYLEAHLRNLNWDAWYAIYGASFEFGVADAVVVTPDGREWYQSLPNAFQTLENEVAYWTSHRISRFQLQWSNDYQFGLHESVSVVNMLGWRQDLTIQSIAFGKRSSKWSTFVLNWAFYDDLWATAVTNGSLVRRAVSYIGDATIEVLLGMYPFTPASILAHNQIGPLQAIDMMLIAPPTALVTACTSYDVAVTLALQADHALLSLYAALPSLVLDPIPLSWQKPENYTFFGGSPFCLFGAGAPFVQPSFSFDDTCGSQVPSRLLVSPWPGLFAATSLNLLETSLKSCCTPCSAATQFSCELLVSNLQVISTLLLTNASLESLLVPMVQAATGAIQQLNVEIVQFALTSGGTETVLRQPLLRDGAWSFMGYVALHEWVNGFREAVSFQGDVATFNLISERIEPIPLRANAIEVPHSTCNYLYVVALLTSVALVAVACITAAYAFLQPTPDADGLHLPVYNQVAGPVWVGRPLLLLRAAAAITMLSTAPLNFGSDDGVARFRFAPRPLTHVGILAGEAAWVTYVLNDILLVAANQYARYAAPLSNLLVWLSLVVLEVFYPIRATAAVDRGCTRVDMGAVVTCHSGSVDLGSMARAWLILGINGIAIGLSYCIVWGYCVLKQKHLDDSEQTPLARMVSAGVEAFLAPKETNMWKLDASIAAMTGLLRFRFQSLCCIFDTKLWLFYYDDAGPVHIKPLISPEETMLTMAGAVVVASSRFAKLKSSLV